VKSEIETERAGNDAPAEPVPPIKAVVEIDRLRLDAEEAGMLVCRLEGQVQEATRLLVELDEKIRKAKAKRDVAVEAYYNVMPKKLPPIPSLAEMIAAARKQRPDADDRQTVMMASRLRGTLHTALAGEGLIHEKPLPAIEGPEVRNVDDHRYNIPATPRERKTYA
jgi:hypothetical protein